MIIYRSASGDIIKMKNTDCYIFRLRRKRLYGYLVCLSVIIVICLNCVTAISCSSPIDQKSNPPINDSINKPITGTPIIDGTFIPFYLVPDWDDSRWELELANLKKLGMHYLILSPTVFTDKNNATHTIYPSKNGTPYYPNKDVVESCLRNASKFGFKVFVGLNSNEKWWSWWTTDSEGWLYTQMEFGNRIAEELVGKYKSRYPETMYGWYWDWEVDNLNYTTNSLQQTLINALNLNIDYLNNLTPGMPIIFSPFMNYRVGDNAYNYGKMWEKIFAGVHFRRGDIFSPQDCIGAGGLTFENASEWFSQLAEAVKAKPGLLFWSNAENFDQRFWTSATLDRFTKQLQVVKPYVSNYISFTYSYYYSPYKVNKYFDEAYSYYVVNGHLPQLSNPDPVENLILRTTDSNKISISWNPPSDKSNLVGFQVFRNGTLIANYQYSIDYSCQTTYTENENLSAGSYQYSVCSYNSINGCSSERSVQYTKKP
ncbi:hypothetical protein BSYN_27710 [Bacteroides sedimenti]|uniref:Fibronectin type-III domain-containing protein n=2 Tax=Bacteroides sedimenti TaxID=2136147 RepID=A0ABM8ILD1_9BACE